MDIKLFINEVIRPLEKRLHINIYLNSDNIRTDFNRNCALIKKGELCENCVSSSHFDKTGRYICIKIQKNPADLLSALFHELGNATMHNIHNVYETNPIFCQAEAEEFARVMCEKLDIPYNGYFREESSLNIVDYYWNLYLDYCSKTKHLRKNMRNTLIDSITNRIISYGIDYKKFLD